MDVFEKPITPPAGPERIAFDPEKWSIGAKPPSLYMKNTFAFESSLSSKPSLNSVRYL